MKKKKSKKFLVRRIIAVFIGMILILITRNLIYHFSVQNQRKQLRLLFHDEIINLTSNIYVKDSIIYIAEEDIKNIFDDTIYYNVGDQELITTYNKHVAVLHLGQSHMLVNDTDVAMQGTLQQIDSKIYLPISDLEIVYDIEIEYAEPTKLVIMESTTKAKKQVTALNDAKITNSKNPFSVTVEQVKRGDCLIVLEERGKSKRVRTALRKYRIYQK